MIWNSSKELRCVVSVECSSAYEHAWVVFIAVNELLDDSHVKLQVPYAFHPHPRPAFDPAQDLVWQFGAQNLSSLGNTYLIAVIRAVSS